MQGGGRRAGDVLRKERARERGGGGMDVSGGLRVRTLVPDEFVLYSRRTGKATTLGRMESQP